MKKPFNKSSSGKSQSSQGSRKGFGTRNAGPSSNKKSEYRPISTSENGAFKSFEKKKPYSSGGYDNNRKSDRSEPRKFGSSSDRPYKKEYSSQNENRDFDRNAKRPDSRIWDSLPDNRNSETQGSDFKPTQERSYSRDRDERPRSQGSSYQQRSDSRDERPRSEGSSYQQRSDSRDERPRSEGSSYQQRSDSRDERPRSEGSSYQQRSDSRDERPRSEGSSYQQRGNSRDNKPAPKDSNYKERNYKSSSKYQEPNYKRNFDVRNNDPSADFESRHDKPRFEDNQRPEKPNFEDRRVEKNNFERTESQNPENPKGYQGYNSDRPSTPGAFGNKNRNAQRPAESGRFDARKGSGSAPKSFGYEKKERPGFERKNETRDFAPRNDRNDRNENSRNYTPRDNEARDPERKYSERPRSYGNNREANMEENQPIKDFRFHPKALKNDKFAGKKSSESGSESREGTRLNRYISQSGVCSRRDADELIKNGQVELNGQVVYEMGMMVSSKDVVTYKGKTLNQEKKIYLLLNKPKDFITTTEDPEDRKTVMNLVAAATDVRIYPVGRLDRNTTGLLMMTNDGELAAKLSHPSQRVSKIYEVELDRNFNYDDLEKLVVGLELEDGFAKVDEAAFIADSTKTLAIEIHNGKNRIVRRMFEHLGYDVQRLDRVMYAGLTKKNIPRGKWRMLTDLEVLTLKHFIQKV